MDSKTDGQAPSEKIRVLQLGVSLAIGGSERLQSAIGRGLDANRFEAAFAATGQDGPIGVRLRAEGFVAEAFDRRFGFDPRLFGRIWKVLRHHRIDIVQSHHVSSLIYGGPPVRLAGAKLVHTEHDAKSFDRYPRNLRWLRWLAPLADRFVAIDPSIGDFLHERVGVPRQHIHVIRNGIDLAEYRPADARPAEHALKVIGWVGRVDIPKRPDVLAEAFVRLAPEYPELRLLMVGAGTLLEDTRRRLHDAGLADRVELAGARLDVAEQLRRMDACILCSDREGLPFTLVEAMATELPCVASAVGGIPALIKPDVNGILLTENDPALLARLLRDLVERPTWAAQLGRAARETVAATYDFRATLAQYEASRINWPSRRLN